MARTILSDLPAELIQHIIYYLDPDTTLNFGKLDRRFNRLALGALLGATNGGTHLYTYPPPVAFSEEHIYRGLSIALAIEDIAEFRQQIYGCLPVALWQIRRLKLQITRLRSLKVFILNIDIDREGMNSMGELERTWGSTDGSGEEFMSELQELMDLVVARGCERLNVDGGGYVTHCKLSASQVRLLLSKQTATAKAWRWTKSHALSWGGTDKSGSPSAEVTGANLKDCILTPVTFLGRTAPSFNLSLLERNANSITRLELSIYGVTRSATKVRALIWGLLDNIDLPKLEILVLHASAWNIPGPPFAWFLSRHPTLKFVTICSPASRAGNLTSHSPINLPKLKGIRFPARMAMWFLKNSVEVPPIFREIFLDTYHDPANLESLGGVIRELRRRTKKVIYFHLTADWWTYTKNLSRKRSKDSLGGPSDLPRLTVKKLVLILNKRPDSCSETSATDLSETFIHLLKDVFTVGAVVIEPNVPGQDVLRIQSSRHMTNLIKNALPTLKSVHCHCSPNQ